MRLAIQEDMLPGETPLEKCQQAQALGINGIEYWGAGLTARVPEIVAAIKQTGVAAAACCVATIPARSVACGTERVAVGGSSAAETGVGMTVSAIVGGARLVTVPM